MSKLEVVRAYRHLYRSGLHAIHYAKPARYVLKGRLEEAFRTGTTSDYDERRIKNTIRFLDNAVQTRQMEHKVLKNLLAVRWWEGRSNARKQRYGLKGLRLL